MRDAFRQPEGYGEKFRQPEGYSEKFRLPDAQREALRLKREEQMFPGSEAARRQIERARRQQQPDKINAPPSGGRPHALTEAEIERGVQYLRDHPELTQKIAFPQLRRLLETDASDITLRRRIWSKRACDQN
jgi:hypothetical protein